MSTKDLAGTTAPHTNQNLNDSPYQMGRWFWVSEDGRDEWMGCVMHIGSNYLLIEGLSLYPGHSIGRRTIRIHFDQLDDFLREEKSAHTVIQSAITKAKAEVVSYMDDIKRITEALGLQSTKALDGPADGSGTALAVLSESPDIKEYENKLIVARDKDLPALFELIKESNERLSQWMTAELFPLEAQVTELESSKDGISDRIFNISIYAGLTESTVQCADGDPASMLNKLHVFQRRLYMDEECLLDYQSGGMSFESIDRFDKWLCKPKNRDRILPFPRCMVSMRVRRNTKERSAKNLLDSFINFELGKLDACTFLYIRNGNQIYRMNCDLDFGELMFPDKALFDSIEPMMVNSRWKRDIKMMTVAEYESRLSEVKKKKKKFDLWESQNPKKHHLYNPYCPSVSFIPSDWSPFNSSNLYYDEAVEYVDDQIKQFNQVALIIQGLFDRSPALHPHPPVKTWTPEGIQAAVELVYDGSALLFDGDTPSFENYRDKCNLKIHADSVLFGQADYWEMKEAEKECRRIDNSWRECDNSYRPERFTPHGNPGPGYLAKPIRWMPRANKAIFAWFRRRLNQHNYYDESAIRTTITVPVDRLFNVSAYKLGDLEQFYRDPRTRADYLKWAPILMAAEEYHRGNSKCFVFDENNTFDR